MALEPARFERLREAIKTSRHNLSQFREVRQELVKEYVGSKYGDSGAEHEVILNLQAQAADTYVQMLTANRPRVLVTARYTEDNLVWFANHFQQAVNNLLKEIKIERTLRQVVLDAFFLMGIVKVYSADTGQMELVGEDEWVDVGMPYAERVSFDDWVHDTSASAWSKKKYCGNRYYLPYRKALQDSSLDQEVVKGLTPESTHRGEREEAVRQMARSENDADQLDDVLELWDIYLPQEKVILTLHMDAAAPLRVVPWDGPESGPYHVLCFSDVPDNIVPLSPAMQLKPLSRMINRLYRKLRAQAERQKDVVVVDPSDVAGGQNIMNASDGDVVTANNPAGSNQIKRGGVDQANLAFTLQSVDQFDRFAGNLQAMAGLGPQADTLGQDQLIAGAVSKREASMRQRYIDFIAGIVTDLGWMLWNDEFLEMPGEVEVGGVVKVASNWTPELREGDWLQYNFDIDPHSVPYKSPSDRLQGIMNFLQNIGMPALPLLAEQGIQLDANSLLEIVSELMDQPRLKQIFKQGQPSQNSAGSRGEAPAQSQNTTRTYERKQVPTGGTNESRSHVLQQALLGQQPNPDQMASLGRPPA